MIDVERWSTEDGTHRSQLEPEAPFDDDGEVVELTELDLLSIEDLDAGGEGQTLAGPPPFALGESTDRTEIEPAVTARGPAPEATDATEHAPPVTEDEDTRPTTAPAA